MSNAKEVDADYENNVCANCGVAEVDEIKLEDCDGCDLVKYCDDKCREDHRDECKKRAKELHDKRLFTHPDGSHLGECPLCFLPMPLDPTKSTFFSCCSKLICDGCQYAHRIQNGKDNCPFCREPAVNEEGREKRMMKRIKANDPAAMCVMGTTHYHEGDYNKAVEYWTKAAELEDIRAHYELGCLYSRGEGVKKDEEKAVYHWEKAAIGGHPSARHNLGCVEHDNGNTERAAKHFIIAANLGDEGAMKELWEFYKDGNITKEDLDATLRTRHATINEMKSPKREAAEAWRKRQRGA
jgi:tetratricopeptide (TPR) repeat protein